MSPKLTTDTLGTPEGLEGLVERAEIQYFLITNKILRTQENPLRREGRGSENLGG